MSEKDEEKKSVEQQSSKTGLIIIIILLIILILGMSLYILDEKGILFSDAEVENKNSNSKKDITEQDKGEETDNVIKPLDLSRCLNNTTNTYSNNTDVEGNYGLSMNVNPDKQSITLSIDWSIFGPISSASAYDSGVVDYQIKGFSKGIDQVFVGDFGQDAMGITLFYIMEDQTVEYTPMFINKTGDYNNQYFEMNYTYDTDAEGKVTDTHFTTSGPLVGANGVIKLYTVDASNESGWRTTIGATKDGSFYDLGEIIGQH